MLLRNCIIGEVGHAPARVDIVLLHRRFGIALLDVPPHLTPDAVGILRQRLMQAGFPAAFPGYLPVVHRRLWRWSLERLPELLSEAFAGQPPLSLRGGDAWMWEVRRILEDGVSLPLPPPVQNGIQGAFDWSRLLIPGSVAFALACGLAAFALLKLNGPVLDSVQTGAATPPAAEQGDAAMAIAASLPSTGAALKAPDSPPPDPAMGSDAPEAAQAAAQPRADMPAPAVQADAAPVAPAEASPVAQEAAAPATGGVQPAATEPAESSNAGAEAPALAAEHGAAGEAAAASQPETTPAASEPDQPDVAAAAAASTGPPAATADPAALPAPPDASPQAAASEPQASPVIAASDRDATQPEADPATPSARRDPEPDQTTSGSQAVEPSPPVPTATDTQPTNAPASAPEAPPATESGPPAAAAADPSPAPDRGTEPVAPAAETGPSPAAPAPATLAPRRPPLEPAFIAALMRRGEALLAIGDISGARRFYERAAEAGSPEAAFAMGRTHDPSELAAMGARGIQPDPEAAAAWYRRAEALRAAREATPQPGAAQ
ncbi:MAG: hypothetical protein QJR07_12490 [Acetobacteraceae bacterium]|nr:hypothetical protein [Acetobacteraceae bacterium]